MPGLEILKPGEAEKAFMLLWERVGRGKSGEGTFRYIFKIIIIN